LSIGDEPEKAIHGIRGRGFEIPDSRAGFKSKLRGARRPYYFSAMSVNEALEYVKALTPRERREFFADRASPKGA
jgi:hypothetical protein